MFMSYSVNKYKSKNEIILNMLYKKFSQANFIIKYVVGNSWHKQMYVMNKSYLKTIVVCKIRIRDL